MKNHPFTVIISCSMMKKKADSPLFRLPRLHLYPPFVTFEKFVVFQLKSPPPCQTISPLRPLRLHRLPLCPPFEKFEKFVVFQLKSPPPCQTISPSTPYRVYRLCMCSPLVQLVKFVVFQVLVRFYSIEKV